MASSGDLDVLLVSYLEFEHESAEVTLTSRCIAIKKQSSHLCIPLEDVLAASSHAGSPAKDKMCKFNGDYKAIEMQPLHSLAFKVCVVKRAKKHKWRTKELIFTCKDHATSSQWIEKIKETLYGPGFSRPRHLLVFINPFGGKCRAPKVFEKVLPYFESAGITTDVIETERQYHARDTIMEYDLSTIDGVVSVGGDGTFSEVLNGLMDRTNKDKGVEQNFRHKPARPGVRIGIIPAGSTDCIVYSTVGTNDPVTSALHIILGDRVGVDVNALYKQQDFVKYSVTMTSYGYYGDLLADSEKLRWMGPKRYNWSGFKKFVLNKSYEGVVSFLPVEGSRSHPQDRTRCFSGCDICLRARHESETSESARDNDSGVDHWQSVEGRFVAINCATVSCRCGLSPEGMSPSAHLGDGCMDLILVSDCSRIDYLRHLTRIPKQNADQFDFEFIQVHRVREFSFQPANKQEEKIFEDSESSGAGSSLQISGESNHSTSSNPVLRHSPSASSVWNCDGEIVNHPNLHIQVHCQLVDLFARGVENKANLESERCPVCCSPYSSCKKA